MFKRIETAWNARTPVYLHNRTKENFIFQMILLGLLFGGLMGWDKYQERREARKKNTTNNTYYLSDYAEQR
jgi:hypothetical protein